MDAATATGLLQLQRMPRPALPETETETALCHGQVKQIVLVLLLAAVAFLPALAAAATEHLVGDDDKVWAPLGFNDTAWAETKRLKAGDTLVFEYDEPSHTAVEDSGAADDIRRRSLKRKIIRLAPPSSSPAKVQARLAQAVLAAVAAVLVL